MSQLLTPNPSGRYGYGWRESEDLCHLPLFRCISDLKMCRELELPARAPNTPRLLTIPDAKSLLTPGTLTQFAPNSKGAEQGHVSSDPLSVSAVRAFSKSGKLPSSYASWWWCFGQTSGRSRSRP